MIKNQDELFEERAEEVLEKVRLDGMRAGATGILGAILKMCYSGKSTKDIQEFCIKSLNKKEMQID